jgi:hypothetical protein
LQIWRLLDISLQQTKISDTGDSRRCGCVNNDSPSKKDWKGGYIGFCVGEPSFEGVDSIRPNPAQEIIEKRTCVCRAINIPILEFQEISLSAERMLPFRKDFG